MHIAAQAEKEKEKERGGEGKGEGGEQGRKREGGEEKGGETQTANHDPRAPGGGKVFFQYMIHRAPPPFSQPAPAVRVLGSRPGFECWTVAGFECWTGRERREDCVDERGEIFTPRTHTYIMVCYNPQSRQSHKSHGKKYIYISRGGGGRGGGGGFAHHCVSERGSSVFYPYPPFISPFLLYPPPTPLLSPPFSPYPPFYPPPR